MNSSSNSTELTTLLTKANSKNTLSSTEAARLLELQAATVLDMTTISLSQIFSLFEIVIEFNNSNSNYEGTTSSIVLEGVKFISEGMNIYSTEESTLVDRYTFLAKNVREL